MKRKIDRKKVKELVEMGYIDREIAKRLGCSTWSIQAIRLQELGINKMPEKGKIAEKVLELWKRGERSRLKIAEKVGTSPIYVSYILLRNGLRKPRKPPSKTYLDFFEAIAKRPVFQDELEEMGFANLSAFYHTLREKGFSVNRFSIPAMNRKKVPNIRKSIYFIDVHKEQALKRLKERFPKVFENNILRCNILKALRIESDKDEEIAKMKKTIEKLEEELRELRQT